MKLSKALMSNLSLERETGMGYQLCKAVMKDGKEIKDILIANGEIVISISGSSDLKDFNPDYIDSISVQ